MFGPKEKKERSLGERLHLKGERCQSPKCAFVRKPYRPGAHGQSKRRTAASDFGRQLREKQIFKISYGLKESNLRRLFKEADRKTGSVAMKLLEILESRLDSVIYRAGLVNSRSAARQLIIHGHILVNQKRVHSPGFEVKPDDVISIRPQSKDKAQVNALKDLLKKYEPPSWLLLDKEKLEVKILNIPQDSNQPLGINSLVESFSK